MNKLNIQKVYYTDKMEIDLSFSPELLADIITYAEKQGKTVSAFLEDAIKNALSE